MDSYASKLTENTLQDISLKLNQIWKAFNIYITTSAQFCINKKTSRLTGIHKFIFFEQSG